MIKVKALFLLVSFLLNTAVGLRCALQKDYDCCDNSTMVHHQVSSIQHVKYHQTTATVEKTDTCCQNAVNNFASLAKLVPQSTKVFIPVAIAFTRSAYLYTLRPVALVQVSRRLLIDERQRPPTPDLRIVIQSFQI